VAEMDGICSAHAMVVRAKTDLVLPEFLPFLMMSDRFMKRAVEISVGSLSPTINWKTLKVQEFALPPLAQQRRLATLLWAVDEAICLHSDLKNSINLGLLSEREAFFSKASKKKNQKVGELFELQLGKMLSPKSKKGNSPRPYLANRNVQWGRFDFSDVQEMDFSDDEYQKFQLQPGDLLVCEGGEVGRSAIWNGEIADCCFQKALHRLRPIDNTVSTEYMLEFMLWGHKRGLFSSYTGHSTIAHLTAVKLRGISVPVADSPEQQIFLEKMNWLQKTAKVTSGHLSCSIQLRDELLKSVG